MRAEIEALLAAHAGSGGILPVTLEELRPSPPAPENVADAGPDPIDRAISHYRLTGRLGAGGMGEVFRADDLALGRHAAIKLLPRRFKADLRDRLLREAEAAARLQHPAIATFYEAGEADGEMFIAMECVPGRTLRDRLREGPIPTEEALAITRCLLEALAHAHAAGLLHRDIKPENIMVTPNGSAKLLDFGIALPLLARSVYAEPGMPLAAGLTGDSRLAGTIGYLAPEQVRGESLDACTDVFQVGAVLYEMLTGSPAFDGASRLARLTAPLTREPDWRALAALALPDGLDALLRQALDRDPSRRPVDATTLLRRLQQLVDGPLRTGLPAIVAVMDLADPDGEVDWVGRALSEALQRALARRDGVDLIPREKVDATLGRLFAEERGPRALGLRLGCGWVVSGTVRPAADGFRARVEIFEVPTATMTATELTCPRQDLVAFQDRFVELVERALGLTAGPAAPARRISVEAHECYARARVLVDRIGKASLDDARALLERAIEIDERHLDARVTLAGTYALRSVSTGNPDDLRRALEMVEGTLAHDPEHAWAHVWKGYVLMRQGRFAEAEPAFRRALVLNPDHAEAHYFAAALLVWGGRPGEALPIIQRAVALDGTGGLWWLCLGATHLLLDERRPALYAFTRARALEASPGRVPTAGAAAYVAEVLRLDRLLDQARAEAVAGIQAAEQSDHMYRDTFRGYALTVLGRVALDADDAAGAHAAFTQVIAQVRGRPRTRGCGHLVVQALSGLARATGERSHFDEGLALLEARDTFSFEGFYGATSADTLVELALAARTLGLSGDTSTLSERARQAGSRRPLPH